MALTLPTVVDLALFQHEDAVENEDWANEALQLAADLFKFAGGPTEDDQLESAAETRLVNAAICDMAWFLLIDRDNREAIYSPFSSERIGSYSYSKVAAAVNGRQATGVAFFDQATDYFSSKDAENGPIGLSFERVMNPGGLSYAEADARKNTTTQLLLDAYGATDDELFAG